MYSGLKLNLTLLVENNEKIESFYRLNLFIWLGLDTVLAHDATGAMKVLGGPEGKLVNLIIVRSKIGKEQTASEVMNFVKSKDLATPVIVIGPGKEIPGSFAHMANSLQLKTMIQGSAKALGITAQAMAEKRVPDFFPIPIEFFFALRSSACPVYEKDQNGFRLLFGKFQEIAPESLKKLDAAGTSELFVAKLDRLEFLNSVTAELMSALKDIDLSTDEQLSAAESTLHLASKKLISMGINKETVALASKSMATMKKNVKGYPKLSKLIEHLIANKTSYRYTHTQLLSYVGLHIIKNIDWGSREQEDKFLFIAFFHDIALEKDEQAIIKSPLELKNSNISPIEKDLVERHAQIAAELATKFPEAPMGADQIIRQHHGNLNGLSFSEHFGNNVSPMSMVFIIAEEFTRIVMKYADGELNRKQMIRELKDCFPTSRFQKMVDLLNTITF